MTDTPPESQAAPPSSVAPGPSSHPYPHPPQRIDQPLRLQWLARRLADRPNAQGAIQQALALDARMRGLAAEAGRRDRDTADRAETVFALARLRLEFDAVVSEALGQERPAGAPTAAPPEGALSGIEPELRVRLAELLGVPLVPEFYPLLEMKAAEYLEQGRAFDQVASDMGFVEGQALVESEARGALILTHNGSLLQISAPGAGGDPRARRFVYQNIYGGKMPAEGLLKLTRPVRMGHKVRTRHMETSPVRKLRVAIRPDVPHGASSEPADWDRLRQTFRSMSQALAPKPPMKTLWGVHPGWHPSFVAKSVEVKRAETAGLAARAELREHLLRLAESASPDVVLEADILGICIHLQRLRADTGEPSHRLQDVTTFVTDRAERCLVEVIRGHAHVILERPARSSLQLPDATVGDQHLVRGAPIALLDTAGSISAVLGDVVWVQPRQSS